MNTEQAKRKMIEESHNLYNIIHPIADSRKVFKRNDRLSTEVFTYLNQFTSTMLPGLIEDINL